MKPWLIVLLALVGALTTIGIILMVFGFVSAQKAVHSAAWKACSEAKTLYVPGEVDTDTFVDHLIEVAEYCQDLDERGLLVEMYG